MKNQSSSGHKLGQIIGDWYEEFFAFPLLEKAASELGLYLDCRFKKRDCRGDKIIWADVEGNKVDYDFVMELGGTMVDLIIKKITQKLQPALKESRDNFFMSLHLL